MSDTRGGRLFLLFGSIIGKNGGVIENVSGRMSREAKVSGAMNRLRKVRSQGVNVTRMKYVRVVAPS